MSFSGETLRKFRAFANGYNAKELEALCRLRRSGGLPFHWGFVSCFLTVQDKAQRKKLQLLAAKENWTVAEVQAEVRQLGKRPRPLSNASGRYPGRPLKRLESRPRALARIVLALHGADRRLGQLCDEWGALKGSRGGPKILGALSEMESLAASIQDQIDALRQTAE